MKFCVRPKKKSISENSIKPPLPGHLLIQIFYCHLSNGVWVRCESKIAKHAYIKIAFFWTVRSHVANSKRATCVVIVVVAAHDVAGKNEFSLNKLKSDYFSPILSAASFYCAAPRRIQRRQYAAYACVRFIFSFVSGRTSKNAFNWLYILKKKLFNESSRIVIETHIFLNGISFFIWLQKIILSILLMRGSNIFIFGSFVNSICIGIFKYLIKFTMTFRKKSE